jgi:hypothetical protein
VNGWAVFFLGVIAVATLGTAIMQAALIVYASRLAGQVTRALDRATRMVDEVERELKPLLASANVIGRDAAHAAALAVQQVERADRVCADVVARIEGTLAAVQRTAAVLSPSREWAAILRGLQAAVTTFRRRHGSKRRRAEEDEALFI